MKKMSPTTVAYLTSTHANHHHQLHSSYDYSDESFTKILDIQPEMGVIRVDPHHHYEMPPDAGKTLVANTNNNNNNNNNKYNDGVVVVVENPQWIHRQSNNGPGRTKDNALKLILLLLSIVFYLFTWNNNLVLQQQWIMTTTPIIYDPHHTTDDDGGVIGFCCNNPNVTTTMVPPPPVPSLPSSQSVVQSLMKRNSLICFLMILIAVTVICEKLFSHHQISIIISADGDLHHHHNHHHHHHMSSGLYNPINKNHNDNDEMPKMETTTNKDYSKPDQSLPIIRLLIKLVRLLPLRLMSKVWGQINGIPLPIILREPTIVLYAKACGCNLDEMEDKDLRHYRNLGEFFRRPLAARFRPINQENGVVSPADGLLVQSAIVPKYGGLIGEIKGINYKIDHFLGNNRFDDSFRQNWSVNVGKIRPGHRLYTTVVYLAPGDYHRFHSPTDWTIKHRRHFSGNLLSVKPSFVRMIPDLFSINERVVYFGEWKYGFFSMAAVGAFNVGTINVFFDQDLRTNQTLPTREYCWEKTFDQGVAIQRGELFGEFNLGSTMVMIYEAPVGHSHWETSVGKKVKYGELLQRIDQ